MSTTYPRNILSRANACALRSEGRNPLARTQPTRTSRSLCAGAQPIRFRSPPKTKTIGTDFSFGASVLSDAGHAGFTGSASHSNGRG